MSEYPYIEKIRSPEDVRAIPEKEIPAFTAELRRFLVDKVSLTGGHLASNLGAVELTVALHRVFDCPQDRLIFDVGHQSYVHKILTGRADRFDTLRTPGGLSGFPTRTEGEYDAFGTGHSSTSVSAALGFAEADARAGRKNYTVAVVGDGAFTGGMIHEAINNCRKELRLIIVINDNGMSISRNTGLLARYLSHIRSTARYRNTKRRTQNFLGRLPLVGKPLANLLRHIRNFIKRHVYHHNYFEDLGFLYFDLKDGNNEEKLEAVLREARRREGAVVVHIRTEKGKGYAPAEKDPTAFHGLSPEPAPEESFHTVAGAELCALAQTDTRVCAVTAAMKEGTGLCAFAEKYPNRFYDVGIAEEHALTFAAGLAAAGERPYFAVYSTFLQRAYDNILHDVALQNLPVRFLVDRAGLAAHDGATHHGIFDVAFLSHVPGLTLWAPATFGSLRAMLRRSAEIAAPLAIRYPNAAEDADVRAVFYPAEDYENFGVRAVDTENAAAVILTYGGVAGEALRAAVKLAQSRIKCGVILLERLKPYEETAAQVAALLPEDAPVVFLEEGIAEGGAGEALFCALCRADSGFATHHPWETLAIRGHFAAPASSVDLRAYCGIDAAAVVRTVEKLCGSSEKVKKSAAP